VTSPGSDAAHVTCGKCGEPNPPHARFCHSCGTRLDEVAAKREERKLVSVLFVDLEGFTARSDQADPEDVRDLLERYHSSSKECIEQYGGVVEKFIGDAIMAIFGVPVSHGDDAERWFRKRSRKQRRSAKTEQERLDVAASVLDGVASLSKAYGNAPVVTDQHARMLVESGLKERGAARVIHRTWSPSSQTEAFRLLRSRVYGDTISLPIDDQLQRRAVPGARASACRALGGRAAPQRRWSLRSSRRPRARGLGAGATWRDRSSTNVEQLPEHAGAPALSSPHRGPRRGA
jgi:Adenylate and Guanylate cyclase catalytic domain/zinc-ribbon domain